MAFPLNVVLKFVRLHLPCHDCDMASKEADRHVHDGILETLKSLLAVHLPPPISRMAEVRR
jgi:hypothetical protein